MTAEQWDEHGNPLRALPDGPATSCKCGGCPIEADYWPDAPTEVARQMAHGAEGGGWACDCMDWTAEDAAAAFEYLWNKERTRRDRLGSDMVLIARHADADHAERGIAEAHRYSVIARDSLKKAGLAWL